MPEGARSAAPCRAATAGIQGGEWADFGPCRSMHVYTPPACRRAVPTTVTMRINPAVLKWVMDSEGWEVDELAEESGLSPESIRRWTTAESDVSLHDLKKMSARFTRPLSTLFMAEAPATTVPKYRRSGGSAQGAKLSRKVLEVVRRARYVQGNAAELLDEMNRDAEPRVRRATIGQNPESAAAESAAALGIEPPARTGKGEDRDRKRYNMIREKIESQNIFTMQENIPDEEMGGFALADARPATVLVNRRDPPRRRIFTILHEYAHVVLDDSGACPVVGARGDSTGGAPGIERWCNKFAGAVLMPKDGFRNALSNAHKKAGDDPLGELTELADRFCVSRMAAAVRAAEILGGGALGTRYARYCGPLGRESRARISEDGDKKDNQGGPGQAALCISRKGRRYANLVLDAAESGHITTSTMLDYLEVKLDSLDDLMIRRGGG